MIFFGLGRGGVRTQDPRLGGISYRPYDIASANISEKCLAISWFLSIRSMVLDRCAVSDQRLSSFRWEHTILVSAKTIFIFSVFWGMWGGGGAWTWDPWFENRSITCLCPTFPGGSRIPLNGGSEVVSMSGNPLIWKQRNFLVKIRDLCTYIRQYHQDWPKTIV